MQYLPDQQIRWDETLIFAAKPWGQRFFELNREPLDAYASAATSEELVNLQFEFFEVDVDAGGP